MIQELLVVLACSEAQGCSNTINAYYSTHPRMKQTMANHKQRAKDAIGPTLLIVSPIVYLLGSDKATFTLNQYFGLQVSKKETAMIYFRINF